MGGKPLIEGGKGWTLRRVFNQECLLALYIGYDIYPRERERERVHIPHEQDHSS